jgi:hypothetical protein
MRGYLGTSMHILHQPIYFGVSGQLQSFATLLFALGFILFFVLPLLLLR